MNTHVNTGRLVNEFKRLVSIDSESFCERSMADYLKTAFQDMGITLLEDNAGTHYGGNAGNLYGTWKGTLSGSPILFCAHMDTVSPGIGKMAVCYEDGTITSNGTTVLGADDAAGIAEIMEAVRCISEQGIPHRDIEFLFPIAEEAYIKGSSVFDFTQLSAKEAYVLDLSGAVGTASLQEPTLISFEAVFYGKAAHAGFAPEEGIHAIAMAAEAITQTKQGRIGGDTTVNIGVMEGGTATNIVPQRVAVKGEIRSYVHEKALQSMDEIRTNFENTAKKYGGICETVHTVHLHAYQVEKEDKVVTRFCKVCEKLGISDTLTATFGGSDNNAFLQHAIHGIVLACGMNQVHSAKEYTTAVEMERAAAIVAELMTQGE
jgi:tripeptide aminopeptidase